MRRPLAIAVLTAALSVLGAVPAPASEELIARADAPTPIAAQGERLVWSVRDAATGRFRLVTHVDGLTLPVAVRSRPVPFDVDLGPDERGHVVAVYSRCSDEPAVPGQGVPGIPAYHRARGCDLYEYDFTTARENRIAGANSPTASEYWPTVWKERVAFARTYDRKPDHPYLYVRPLVGGGRSERLPGGQRRECRRDRRTGALECSPGNRSAPSGLELYGRRLAFGWRFLGLGETWDWDLRMDTVGGGHRRVDHADGSGLTALELVWPGFEAGRLYWARNCYGDPGGCVGRYRLARYRISTGEQFRAIPPGEFVVSHDRAAGRTWLLRDRSGVGDCQGDPPSPGGTCELVGVRPDYRPVD